MPKMGAIAVKRKDMEIVRPAKSFAPVCPKADGACAAWVKFRQKHPYPYQSMLAKELGDGSAVLVISEPSPVLSRNELDKLLTDAFGEDLLRMDRRQWMIGVDGWVEDVILHVKVGASVVKGQPEALLRDRAFRERIALLHHALFGTSFGARLESFSGPPAGAVAPNLNVSPAELRKWMLDWGLKWRSMLGGQADGASWSELAARNVAGTFVSADGALVLLTFPKSVVEQIRRDRAGPEGLRAVFREFAASSDAIVGGIWDSKGMVGIVGRGRINPVESIPPLRFETFLLLAAQTDASLAQSYERGVPLAGKILEGKHRLHDWAPIYLSPDLVDTELGALLNITDQMLKSWSQAGTTEYLYFSYPMKPKNFPFERALSEILNSPLRN